jgi:hypothetical protein
VAAPPSSRYSPQRRESGDRETARVYFVDRKPGNYEVTAATEAEKKLTFTLAPK